MLSYQPLIQSWGLVGKATLQGWKMKDTGQEDVPENADLNEISEQREEISEADDANAKDDESNRVVVLQKGRKESIGINLIRLTEFSVIYFTPYFSLF